jgi:ketosteroid isomerase-like protein
MSERDGENITRLRLAYEAFNRGDFDAAVEVGGVHPDIEYRPPGGQSPVRGIAQFRAWMEPEAFESQVIEPREFRVAGNKILVWQHTSTRGAGSGIEMELDLWAVWTLDDAGLVIQLEAFLPHEGADARRAAGLEE